MGDFKKPGEISSDIYTARETAPERIFWYIVMGRIWSGVLPLPPTLVFSGISRECTSTAQKTARLIPLLIAERSAMSEFNFPPCSGQTRNLRAIINSVVGNSGPSLFVITDGPVIWKIIASYPLTRQIFAERFRIRSAAAAAASGAVYRAWCMGSRRENWPRCSPI